MPVPREDSDQTRGYRTFVSVIKAVLRVLIVVFLVVVAYFLIKSAYQIGYQVTGSRPLSESADDAVRTMVVITDSMSAGDIGELLISRGLIDEDRYAFVLQEFISGYHDEIAPGTYVLDSSMTVEEMIHIMAGAEEEENDG